MLGHRVNKLRLELYRITIYIRLVYAYSCSALDGIGLGVIGYFVPRILGVGYSTISDILNARLALGVLALVMVAKAAALLVSLGSETSSGLLASMFTIGAALGLLYAGTINHFFPSAHLSLGAFALVVMSLRMRSHSCS